MDYLALGRAALLREGSSDPFEHELNEETAQASRPTPQLTTEDALADLGPRTIGPLVSCSTCDAQTWARHRGFPVCRRCAINPATSHRLAYRAALGHVWDLVAEGERADPEECRRALAAEDALAVEIGEPTASTLRARWARDH